MTRFKRLSGTVAVLAVLALVASACSGGSSTSVATKSGGTLTFALDQEPAGFNYLKASSNLFVTREIMDQIWPNAFVVQPSLKPVLNSALLTSATLTKTNPQTIVYKINPKATWSDGTPINAQDFIYAWQSQSGNPQYKDVGGQAYLPASTSGYSQIQSVTSSNGGETATVVFSTPYGDWKQLFAPMVPAHIAQKAGFNNGFDNFGAALQVSGGPYKIQSYSQGQALVEVPNTKYWGTPPKLSQIIYRFILSDDQQPPAIQTDEVQMVSPALASVNFYDSVKSLPGFHVSVKPALQFQHLDFNEANPYLANVSIRHALAYGTDRQAITARTANQIDPSIKPLQNRIFMPTQGQFSNTGGSYGNFNPTEAKSLLKKAGMTMGSDGYFHPNYGPEKGQDFTLRLSTTSGVPVRQQIEELFQAEMKSIGVKIDIQNYTANKLFGTVGPKGEFDIIEFAWVGSPFASANQSIYCSYTSAKCGNNWEHYANPTVDSLLTKALTTANSTQATSYYNQADSILWKDMVTLPLFQQPALYGWSTKYGGIVPNTSVVGLPWNAQNWGLLAQ